jgi:hypothetical protein
MEPPSLVLSDLVHGMTPSPAPLPFLALRRSTSPEEEEGEGGDRLGEEEVAAMRRRVEFNLADDQGDMSTREKELVDMVCFRSFLRSFLYVGVGAWVSVWVWWQM